MCASFDLRILFSGLAMYVPDGSTTMHVLMPATRGHEHGTHTGGPGTSPHDHGGGAEAKAMEPHYTRLFYDRAYENPDATQLLREYVLHDLEGRSADLVHIPTAEAGIDLNLPDEIPLLDDALVSRDKVTGLPSKVGLAGRITFGSGALTHYALGTVYRRGSVAKRMSPRTEWTVRGITSVDAMGRPALSGLVLWGPGEGDEYPLRTLYPIGGTIHMMAFNSVWKEFPPKGPDFFRDEAEEDAQHFDAYYSILGLTARSAPVPGTVPEIIVTGATVSEGDETPGLQCVQSQARLA